MTISQATEGAATMLAPHPRRNQQSSASPSFLQSRSTGGDIGLDPKTGIPGRNSFCRNHLSEIQRQQLSERKIPPTVS